MFSAELFACNVCNAIFGIKKAYDTHMKRKHQLKKKRFSCNLCDFSTDYTFNIKRHQLTYTKEKKIVCGQCEKRFIRKSYVNMHIQFT